MTLSLTILFYLIAIWIAIKTIVYGIYEIRKCENLLGGTMVIIFSLITLVGFVVSMSHQRHFVPKGTFPLGTFCPNGDTS